MKTGKIIPYVTSCISGIVLVVCFPTFDLFFLAWIALVPFLLSLYDKKPKQAFTMGIVLGIIYFFGTLYWIYHSINHYGHISFITSIIIVFLLCMYLSLFTGIFALFFSAAIKKTRLPALFIAPVLWVSLEFLRSYLFTGFPWSSIGYTQYAFLHLIQFADITGIYGVSFLILAVNGAFTDIALMKKRISDMPLFPWSYTVVGMSLLVLFIISSFIYGYWRIGQERPGKNVRIGIIQGNIEQDKKWEPAYQSKVIETYKDLSIQAASSSPSIIIWPETAIPFYFNIDREYTQQLIELPHQLTTYLLFGAVVVKDKKAGRNLLTNSAVLLDKDGRVSYLYDKIHLVPFGEYVPLRNVLFFMDKLVSGVGDYVKGNHYLRAETPYGGFATLICYEIIFPGLVRKFFIKNGDFIVNITNDAWFGKTTGPYQHFSMAVFRAIENRKPVLRAANTGISGVIDSNGRIHSQTGLFKPAILIQDIKTDSTRSFYSKFGDLFSFLCIVFSILISAHILGKTRKS